MIDKIVVIPDSFKNTMSSEVVCETILNAFEKMGCEIPVYAYPIADGGEGTALIFSNYLKLKMCKMATTNAYNKEIIIEYGSDGATAVMDIASVVGFGANSGEQLNPQITTTYGVGVVLRKLIEDGHKKIYVGLGGSITNDLGLGMLCALGVDFFDAYGKLIVPVGKDLKNIKRICLDNMIQYDGQIICLSDVKSPLLGDTGAAKMFSPQKGASLEMVEELEEDTKIFLAVAKQEIGDFSEYEGSGAAGGLGYAFKAFLSANIKSGIKEVIKISNVAYNMDEKTLVITGEGSFDKQSLEGKVISGIIDMVKTKEAKMIVVAGVVEDMDQTEQIDKCFACSEKGRSIEEIKKTCVIDLEKTIKKVYLYIKEKYSIK